jgi:hypothetical protein
MVAIGSSTNGIKNCRVKKTVTIAGKPKNKETRRSINLFKWLLIAPTKLVEPTINNEYEVAVSGERWKRYTSSGTVRIDPPLPVIPSDIPINAAKL